MNKIQKILLCAFMAINSNVHSAQEDYKKIPIEIQSEVILGQQGIRLNPERNTSTQINRFDLSLGFAFYFKEDGKDLFRLIEETQKWSDGQHARKRFRQAENLLKKFIWHGYEFLEGSRINTCISARFRAGWLGIQGNTYLDDGKGASSFDWPTTNLEFYKVNSVAGPILTIENKEIHLGLLVKMWDFLFVSLNINPKICNVWDYNLLDVITTPAPNSIGKRLELINKNIKCNVQYFKIVTGRATKECKDEFAFVKESCRKNGFVDGLVYAWLFFHQVVRVDVKINALRSLRSINSLTFT
jgi:hypothetical protein